MVFQRSWTTPVAAVALYVAHYNLCRVHEALKTTPAKALRVADRAWTIGALIDAALATQPITPVPTAPERRKRFTVSKAEKASLGSCNEGPQSRPSQGRPCGLQRAATIRVGLLAPSALALSH